MNTIQSCIHRLVRTHRHVQLLSTSRSRSRTLRIMAQNSAAWLMEANQPMVVKEAPYPTPQANEVIIRVQAAAINPMDYKMPRLGWLKLPTVMGGDAAGTVVEVGSAVTSLTVHDRVMCHCWGFLSGGPRGSAYQNYVAVSEQHPIRIPDHMTFAQAAVLPVCSDTAIAGLYVEDFLGLQYPGPTAKPTGKVLLVWGGSSSVGCSIIQMAAASGYEVAVVAGKRNHEFCRSLGASMVFDHSDANIVTHAVQALQGREMVGAYDAIGDHTASTKPCAEILSKTQGSKKLICSLHPPESGLPSNVQAMRVSIPQMLEEDVVPEVLRPWMEEALKTKQMLPKPDPLVVGKGLEFVQPAVEQLEKGVSARKLVVEL